MATLALVQRPPEDLAIHEDTDLAIVPRVVDKMVEYLSPDAVAMVLQDDADLEIASNIINDIKHFGQALDAAKKAATGPHQAKINGYRELCKPAERYVAAARELWDGKVRALTTARAEANVAATAALQAAVQRQDAAAATTAIQAFQAPTETKGLTLQEMWDFEERNHDLVPTSLTTLNGTAVRAEIKRQLAEGVTEPAISGLRVFKKTIVKGTR